MPPLRRTPNLTPSLVPAMTNDQKFPEDDKTRIGMGVEFFSPDRKPQPPATPVNDSEKTRIGSGLDIGRPEPPAADAGFDSPQRPRFAGEQVTITPQAPVAPPPRPAPPRPPIREEDLFFEAETAAGAVEMPLSSGLRLTVGRDTTQDIILDDRTLSREHLVLERRGDKVVIQVLGLNGLVHNGITHKSTTIEIAAPAAFTVGRILCRLRKKIDTNATLFMADPAEFAKAQQQQPAPPPRDPFAGHPAPRGGDFRQPAPPPFPGGDFSGDTSAPQAEPAPAFPPASSRNAFDDFEGQSSWEDPFSQPADGGLKSGFPSQKTGISRYLLLGGAALLGILLVVALVLFFTRDKDDAPPKAPTAPPPAAQQAAPPLVAPAPAVAPPAPAAPAQSDGDPKNYNLHGRFFNEAYRYYNEGNYTMACDYLKDIPATSAFRERAENLAQQMGNCKLND